MVVSDVEVSELVIEVTVVMEDELIEDDGDEEDDDVEEDVVDILEDVIDVDDEAVMDEEEPVDDELCVELCIELEALVKSDSPVTLVFEVEALLFDGESTVTFPEGEPGPVGS